MSSTPVRQFLLLLLLFTRFSVLLANDVSPFTVVGRVSSKLFFPGDTNAHHESEGEVSFFYSNRWWQAEIAYNDPKKGEPAIQNCMRVPDGTRSYTLFGTKTNAGKPIAIVCRTAFPTPGHPSIFVAWLGLCPKPDLPLIDAQRMRRFISVPNCQSELLTDQRNVGSYSIKYLAPQHVFISELSISNNGTSIEVNVSAKGEIVNDVEVFPPPFENGFTEFEYRVAETTNVNGLIFPLRMNYRRFSPNFRTRTQGQLGITLFSEITVTQISFPAGQMKTNGLVPVLVALDARPPTLPKNRTANYLVTNDHWRPASDPHIVHLANMEREISSINKKGNSLWFSAVIILTFAVPPVVFLYKHHNKQQK